MMFHEAVAAIIAAGRRMHAMGWVPATAGNLSLREPSGCIAITRSGCHKGFLSTDDVIRVDAAGGPIDAGVRPSYETLLHCGIYARFADAGAVLHGHSLANTVLSRRADDRIRLAGYELLKAFPGGPTHDAAVDVPVLDNDQDIARLQTRARRAVGYKGRCPAGLCDPRPWRLCLGRRPAGRHDPAGGAGIHAAL